MDRCALFVDAGYTLADGAMAVHGTRRRDSVSWDYAGLLQLLASLARDRTGLPVLRCYWYETVADGGKTGERDALAEMPGLKLRTAESRRGRREGIESHLRRDLLTLAKNGAISDAFIASADDAVAEIVSEAQDLGVRVVVLHISANEGWTIPQPLRQECDDIVEISRIHLRPHVELIQGAEPADSEDQLVPASAGALMMANGIGDIAVPDGAVATDAPRPVAAALRAVPAGAAGDGVSGGSGFGQNVAFQPAPLGQASAPAPGGLPASDGTFAAPAGRDGSLGVPPGGAAFTSPAPAQEVRVPDARTQPGQQGGGQLAPPHNGEIPRNRSDASSQAGPYLPGGQVPGQQYGAAADGYRDGQGYPARSQRAGAETDDRNGAVSHGAVPAAPRLNGSGLNGVGANGAPANGGYPNAGYPNGGAVNGGMNGGYPNGGGSNGSGLSAGGTAGARPNGYVNGGGFDVDARQQAPGSFGGYPNGNSQNGADRGRPPQVGQGPQAGGHGAPYSTDQHGYPFNGPVPAGQVQNGPAPSQPTPNGSGGYPNGAGGYQPAAVAVQNPLYRSPEQPGYPAQPGNENGQRPSAVPVQRGSAYPDSAQFPGQGLAQPPALRAPAAVSLPDAVRTAHAEGFSFGESVGRDAPGLWLEAVLARKPRMPSDLEARLLQGSALPIDSLLHDEVRHSLRRGFWEALESARR